MESKTGVYICTGCDIGEAVNPEGLQKVATSEYKVPVCKTHPFLCSDEGVKLLKDDLKNEGVDRFILGACSNRYHQDTFDLGAETMVVRVPLREYVAWSQPHQDEDTQMMAEDYIRMYAASNRKQGIPVPFEQDTDKSLLVIGGGVTGMTAAIEAARAGYDVNLVEKESELGGFARKLYRAIPSQPPYTQAETPNYRSQIEEVENHPRISIFKSTTIDSISGQPGEFKVALKNGSSSPELKVGAVVLATGGTPYDAAKLTHLGSAFDNVITNVEMEEMAAAGKIARKDGGVARRVAFIQCAGSRDPEHLPYCSSFCCTTSLKQAAYVREASQENKAYIIYKDMITPGQYESFYRAQQNDPGVFLTKGEVVGVKEAADKSIIVEVDHTLLGEKIQLEVDLLVLAVGLESSTKDDPILNLNYRQGPGLPDLKYGFPDSHFICFPYETRRTGIYAAGTVRQPMDMNFAQKDAAGAALKSIQAVEQTDRGRSVHPRVGDTSFPEFRLDACTACKRCTEECPFGVLEEDEKGTPFLNPARCRRCGVCMGACPVRIISFKDYSIDTVGEMIKNIDIPDEFSEKPRILIFACENDAVPVFDIMALNRIKGNPYVRIIPLRCLGGTNLVWVSDALSVGFDGVMFMGCKLGDDYQCHFIKGSEIAKERLGKVQETIGRLQLEQERVQQYEITMNDYEKVPKIIEEFMAMIDRVGPNPFKDM